MVTDPVTLAWSWLLLVFPGVLPPISTLKVAPLSRSRSPVPSVPGLSPGATLPPVAVTGPPIVPLPPSVPPLTLPRCCPWYR